MIIRRNIAVALSASAIMFAVIAASPAAPRAEAALWYSGTCWVHTVPQSPGRVIPVWNGVSNPGLQVAANWEAAIWDQQTAVSLPAVADFWASKINQVSANYGATGWAGLTSVYTCPSPSTSIQYNDYYIGGSGVAQLNVACHELGHALGLDHSANPASCMYGTQGTPDHALAAEYGEVHFWYSLFYT